MASANSFYQDKIAVVTGAGSGIGRAIALALGQAGARVHCADINADAAAATATQIGNAQAHAVDVTDADAVVTFAQAVYDADECVDLLCNNAGIGHAALVADTTLADWRAVLEVNVMGVVNGLHAFLPRLQAQGGSAHIANTASMAGLVAPPRMAAYAASKHAVVGLSQTLAAELAGSGIGVTILCPGIINTPIVASSRMRGETASMQATAVEYYKKKGTSPETVAAHLLTDIRKGRLFCITPRAEVGIGWLAQRISPLLAQRLGRLSLKSVMGGG